MALFGKHGTPVEQILQMRQQGMTDNQVVQALQKQGLNTQQIFDAMSQADLKKISTPTQAGPAPPPAPEMAPQAEYPQEAYPQAPAEYAEAYPAQAVPTNTDERIHEVAEAIINEKWDELVGEVKKVITWKESVESDIQKIKDNISSIKEEFNQLRQGVLGKIGEYDERMRDVGSEMKAVQKVFKDVIPAFTENVAELSRLTQKLKKK